MILGVVYQQVLHFSSNSILLEKKIPAREVPCMQLAMDQIFFQHNVKPLCIRYCLRINNASVNICGKLPNVVVANLYLLI